MPLKTSWDDDARQDKRDIYFAMSKENPFSVFFKHPAIVSALLVSLGILSIIFIVCSVYLLSNKSPIPQSIYTLKNRILYTVSNTHEGEVFKSLEQLSTQVMLDNNAIRSLADGGLIEKPLFSVSKHFFDSTKDVDSKKPDIWVDYSTQKITNNNYTVNVSKRACELINKSLTDIVPVCTEGVIAISLRQKQ